MYCPKCGCKIEEGASFCHNCGAPISNLEKDIGESKSNVILEPEVNSGNKTIIDSSPTYGEQNLNHVYSNNVNEYKPKMSGYAKVGLWIALYSWLLGIFPVVPLIGVWCSYQGKKECEEKGLRGLSAAKWGICLNILMVLVKMYNLLRWM